MFEIKTIVARVDAAETFDENVNLALKAGFRLVKRYTVLPNQPHNGGTYFHPTLIAEMEKRQ